MKITNVYFKQLYALKKKENLKIMPFEIKCYFKAIKKLRN